MTYAESHNVRTDMEGWPVGVTPEERERLTACVREALNSGPMPLHVLYAYANARNALPAGALYDYLYACVDRAARAVEGCELVYAMPITHMRMPPAVRLYGRRLAEWRGAAMGELGDGKPASTRKLLRSLRAIITESWRAMSPDERRMAACQFGELPPGAAAEEIAPFRAPKARA